MTVRDELNNALKEAMRLQDRRRLCTIRLIQAAIKDRDIAARTQGQESVSAEAIQEILAKMMRQREETIRTYEEAGRIDLAEQEAAELDIIRSFMVPQMDDAEIAAAVEGAIRKAEATCLRDVGRTMAVLKEDYAGRMDFSKACATVKARLGAPSERRMA